MKGKPKKAKTKLPCYGEEILKHPLKTYLNQKDYEAATHKTQITGAFQQQVIRKDSVAILQGPPRYGWWCVPGEPESIASEQDGWCIPGEPESFSAGWLVLKSQNASGIWE